jgi:HK97 family phage major capsid protein
MGAETNSVTMKELREMIKTECGAIVAEAVKDFQTKNAEREQSLMAKILSGEIPYAKAKPKPEAGMRFGQMLHVLGAVKGDLGKAVDLSVKRWGKDDDFTKELSKAMTVSDTTAGGTLVPEVWSTDVIEFLRPMAVVRSVGPLVLPMEKGNLTIPRISGGSTSYYSGEGQNMTNSQQATDAIRMAAKKLTTITPLSNDLIRQSGGAADTMSRNDTIRSMAAREDLAFIRGDGTSDTPRGLKNLMPQTAAAQIPSNATVNLANVITDLGKIVTRLVSQNIPMINVAWIMSSRSENYLKTVLTANGQFVFRAEMDQGKLWGFPYRRSNQIPENLSVVGSGANESEVYLADFADVVIGDTLKLIVDVSTEAAFYDAATATIVSAFSKDLTVMRVISEHDLALRHQASAAMLTGVLWGT